MTGTITVKLREVANFYSGYIQECIVRYTDPATKIVYKKRISFHQASLLSQLEQKIRTDLSEEEVRLLQDLPWQLYPGSDVVSVTDIARNCDYILRIKD